MNLPTPIELLQDKGVIGEILRQLTRPVLDEAEKQNDPWTWLAKWVQKNPVEICCEGTAGKLDAECAALDKKGFRRTGIGVYSTAIPTSYQGYQGVREVHFNYYKPNPRKIIMRLMTNQRWPDSFRKTFVAAASKWEAELRLAEIARGGGSISQSWRLKIRAAQKSGRKMADHWADKVAASILQWETGRQWLLYNKVEGLNAPPKICEVARQKYEKFYAADLIRLGRKKANEKWKGKSAPRYEPGTNDGDYIVEAMVTHWLTVDGNGFPGFCFMSDKILAELLGHTLPLKNLLEKDGCKIVRTWRERIGLKKAEIFFTGVEKVGDNKWAILDRRGKKTHWFSSLRVKPLPPKL